MNPIEHLPNIKEATEELITSIPKAINGVRDMSSHFSVEEALTILQSRDICEDYTTEHIMNSFRGVESKDGEMALIQGLTEMHKRSPAFSVYTCQPIRR